MKNKIISTLTIMAMLSIYGCKKETAKSSEHTENLTTIQQDSAILSNDSATVETAVGVPDEENNAIKQEKKAEENLNKAEEK